MRIIWKGSAATSIAKAGGLLHHLSTFETPTVAAVWGFLFNVLFARELFPFRTTKLRLFSLSVNTLSQLFC